MTRIPSCYDRSPASFSFYRATRCGDRWVPFDAPILPTGSEAAGFAVAACALMVLFAVALGS